MEADELALDPEEMRRLGYLTVDLLVDHLREARSRRLITTATREDMEARLLAAPPEEGAAFEEVLGRIRRDVLPFIARRDDPGYMAFILAGGTWPALSDLDRSSTRNAASQADFRELLPESCQPGR